MILAQLNIFIQFIFLFCVLVSLQLRAMGKTKAFGISMTAIVLAFVVSFISVLLAFPNDPMFTTHASTTLGSTTLTSLFGVHLSLALVSIGSAVWTLALWFRKTDFLAKSRIPSLITQFSWLIAFAMGLWLFVALNL